MSVVSLAAGALSDLLVKRTGATLAVRKVFVCSGFCIGSSLLLLLALTSGGSIIGRILVVTGGYRDRGWQFLGAGADDRSGGGDRTRYRVPEYRGSSGGRLGAAGHGLAARAGTQFHVRNRDRRMLPGPSCSYHSGAGSRRRTDPASVGLRAGPKSFAGRVILKSYISTRTGSHARSGNSRNRWPK